MCAHIINVHADHILCDRQIYITQRECLDDTLTGVECQMLHCAREKGETHLLEIPSAQRLHEVQGKHPTILAQLPFILVRLH